MASNNAPIIDVQNLVKTYDTGVVSVKALRNVSVSVDRGEMVSVMGPSGCGKTTLLNCLSGIDDLTEGTIWIEGTDINSLSDDDKTIYRAQRMGFIFQFYNLLPVLSAEKNVELPLLLTNLSRRERKKRALAALAVVGLQDRAGHRPTELSGGQEQRVAIARAIVSDPGLLVCDEPTGDLDRATADEILELLQLLNREYGKTIVMVTHDPKAADHANHCLYLDKGSLTGSQTV